MEDKSEIDWASMASEGMIVYRTAVEMVGRHAGDGSVAWRMALPAGQQSPPPQLCDDLLFVFEPQAGIAVINPATGLNLSRVQMQWGDDSPAGNPGNPLNPGIPGSTVPQGTVGLIRSLDQQWQILTPSSAIAMGPDGNEKWRGRHQSLRQAAFVHQFISDYSVVLLGRIGPPEESHVENLDEGGGQGLAMWPLPPGGGAGVIVRQMLPPPGVIIQPLPGGPRAGVVPGQGQVPGWPGAMGPQGAARRIINGRMWPEFIPKSPYPAGWVPRIHSPSDADPQPAVPPDLHLEVADEALDTKPKETTASYKLYVLDRITGVVREERDITGLTDPIDSRHATFLDNRLVMTAGEVTLVVPGASK